MPVTFADTLRVRDTCVCRYAQRLARLLARHFDHAFRPLELTNQQFSLLMSLNRPSPPTMAQVADDLLLDHSTLTAALKPLVRRALVCSVRDGGDARVRRMSLTATGGRLLARALPRWERAQAEAEGLLPAHAAPAIREIGRALAAPALARNKIASPRPGAAS